MTEKNKRAQGEPFSFEDTFLECRDCGIRFLFTAREQGNYARQGYDNLPSRCPACRLVHRRLRRR
jgi:hypothetical protein